MVAAIVAPILQSPQCIRPQCLLLTTLKLVYYHKLLFLAICLFSLSFFRLFFVKAASSSLHRSSWVTYKQMGFQHRNNQGRDSSLHDFRMTAMARRMERMARIILMEGSDTKLVQAMLFWLTCAVLQ